MRTQLANPGGVLSPEEVIGRDALAVHLWKVLTRRSLYITAERRMGKTSIVRDKMGKAPPTGWKLIYMDVSRAVSALQFVEALLQASREHLDASKKAKFAFFELVNKLAGVDIKSPIGLKLPEGLGPDWKMLLETLLRDIASADSRIVLAFDELPLMLDAIKRREERREGGIKGEALVMELLDTLRAARQENPGLRMIFTGSLGLHHVLTALRDQGYQNDPVNDMALIDLEPLTTEDAAELARRLFAGEAVTCDDLDSVATYLASATDGIAYYIQHIVAEVGSNDEIASVPTIDKCLKNRLVDPLDPWRLNYYDERIDTHYPIPYRPIARAILDQLAARNSMSLEELAEGINPETIERDAETVRKVIGLLGLDHYITIEDKRYRFRSPFILRIWRNRREGGE